MISPPSIIKKNLTFSKYITIRTMALYTVYKYISVHSAIWWLMHLILRSWDSNTKTMCVNSDGFLSYINVGRTLCVCVFVETAISHNSEEVFLEAQEHTAPTPHPPAGHVFFAFIVLNHCLRFYNHSFH